MIEKGIVEKENILNVRQLLQHRREEHERTLWEEATRLTAAASELGVRRVILFGSLLEKKPGLTSDLDLIIVWETPLGFLERTVELYRRLQPRVATDLLVYTPSEMDRMVDTPLVKRALEQGKVLYEA